MVMPQTVFENTRTREVLTSRLENMSAFPFPKEHRHFDECVVFGVSDHA